MAQKVVKLNLYLRLIKLFVKLMFSKDQTFDPFDEKVVQTYRVALSDIDLFLHMNNGKYLSILDLGRVELMYRSKILKLAKEMKGLPVVGEINIKYKRQFFLFQKFTVETYFEKWDDKWVYFKQVFIRKGTIRAEAIVKGCIADKVTGRAIPTDQMLEKTNFNFEKKYQKGI